MKNNEEAVKRLILRKFEKIAKLEKEVWEKVNQNNLKTFEKRFVESHIYACVDGFALVRYFNENSNSFSIFGVNERIEIFKSHIPIFSLEKKQYIFPLGMGIGGSMTFGNVTFGGVDFGALQVKVESNQNLENLTEELEEFILYFEQNINVEEAKKRIDDLINQNNSLKNRLINFHTPLIITEGKTDWKHILRALKYYHSKNKFLEVKPEYFLKYGSKEDTDANLCGCDFEEHISNARLEEFLRSSIESRKLDKKASKNIRIGIFDSDAKNKLHNNHDLKIFSFEIEPRDISVEFLYKDSEIKTLFNNRRLYNGLEFDSKSKRHIIENVTLGGDNNSTNKAGKNVIIDKDVFNLNHENIALSKSAFSIAVFNDEITISNESWGNFKHIFEKIDGILNT